jgi:hypothetical protein
MPGLHRLDMAFVFQHPGVDRCGTQTAPWRTWLHLGIKDDRGGATVPFSYRYYVYRELPSDEQIASELKTAGPFLVTRDPAIKVDIQGSVINVSTNQEVYEYHSSTLFRHTDNTHYTPVTINLCNHSSGLP